MAADRRRFTRHPANLAAGGVAVGPLWRTYGVAPAQPRAPLLIALHGLGMTGRNLATFSGLAERGPAAGFATVFPDGADKMWDDGRYNRQRSGVDDVAFLRALIDQLIASGVARTGPVFLAGVSNGAFFAEYVARNAFVPVAGLALVSGSTAAHNARETPRPRQSTAVTLLCGTADPMVPYYGGQPTPGPLLGRRLRRRSGLPMNDPRRAVVGTETVAGDWAAANGLPPQPIVDAIPAAAGDPPVQRLQWSAPGRPSVVVYRIEGGGHGWPGGPQYLPAHFIGQIPRQLDATGILLGAARARADSIEWPTR